MRKVIQIMVAVHEGKGKHDYPDMLYALCDDGSLWYASCLVTGEEWRRISDIPQESPPGGGSVVSEKEGEYQTEVRHLFHKEAGK